MTTDLYTHLLHAFASVNCGPLASCIFAAGRQGCRPAVIFCDPLVFPRKLYIPALVKSLNYLLTDIQGMVVLVLVHVMRASEEILLLKKSHSSTELLICNGLSRA